MSPRRNWDSQPLSRLWARGLGESRFRRPEKKLSTLPTLCYHPKNRPTNSFSARGCGRGGWRKTHTSNFPHTIHPVLWKGQKNCFVHFVTYSMGSPYSHSSSPMPKRWSIGDQVKRVSAGKRTPNYRYKALCLYQRIKSWRRRDVGVGMLAIIVFSL